MPSPADDEIWSAYKLMGLTSDSELKDIKKTFRRLSLLWHPDKVRLYQIKTVLIADKRQNPDDPQASARFDQLKRAFDLLSDPERLEAIAYSLKQKEERDKRFAGFDLKRKADLADLEAREKAANEVSHKARFERTEREQKLERAKAESTRLRSEHELANAQSRQATQAATRSATRPGSTTLKPSPTIILLRWKKSERPTWTDPAALHVFLRTVTTTLPLDAIVFSKTNQKKTSTMAKAFVEMPNRLQANTCVSMADRGDWLGVQVEIVGDDEGTPQPPSVARKATEIHTHSLTAEEKTLNRLRERQKLEEELRRSEASLPV